MAAGDFAQSAAPVVRAPILRRGSKGSNSSNPYIDLSYLDHGQRPQLDHEDIRRDHEWHFRFNRRLANFSSTLTSMAFTPDGSWLFAGAGSGDVKVWSARSWGESATLQCARMEEFRSLTVSPAQRWLVCVQPSALYVFSCGAPWSLEQVFPADEEESGAGEWRAAIFSPLPEVHHDSGRTGQDNYLATVNGTNLCLMSYGRGWGQGLSRRTHSLLPGIRPTGLAYTNCGSWLVTAYDNGQLQIWNACSLANERVLKAHAGSITCLIALPDNRDYDGVRLVTAGVDARLKVWKKDSNLWREESSARDKTCDGYGVRSVAASSDGMWVVSMAKDLFIWRVCVSQHGLVSFRIHQRLQAVSSSEVLLGAALSPNCDALAVGTRDGVLGIFKRHAGVAPTDSLRIDEAESAQDTEREAVGVQRGLLSSSPMLAQLRPMRRVMTDALSSSFGPGGLLDPTGSPSGSSNGSPERRLNRTVDPRELSLAFAQGQLSLAVPKPTAARSTGCIERASSLSDKGKRWNARGFEFDAVVRPIVARVSGVSLTSAASVGSPAAMTKVNKAERSFQSMEQKASAAGHRRGTATLAAWGPALAGRLDRTAPT
eukprot:TRINITY_DN26914_c0_g2_i1.p1 TRINITY_DN26914_c0_g2~~TRINITY_DN26914_c0_g2_i1.p1  ORF type:complete len:599 (-),score=119.92 TRINITY_DN26914_c0_g2_i1:17-1813(-)